MSQSFTSNQIYTQPAINGGRLSLTSGQPVANASAQGTLYWVPYKSSYIALYNGVRWLAINAGEKSLALTLTSGKVYDVFGYLNSSGTLQLETLVWTNTTTRATNLTTQDGCYVKSGDATRRYLGTIYASGTNQCTDSTSIRGVWNIDNREERPLNAQDSTNSWTYNSTSWRSANSSTTYGVGRVGAVVGLTGINIQLYYNAQFTATTAGFGAPGIGVNSTTVSSGINSHGIGVIGGVYTISYGLLSMYVAAQTLGFSFYQSLEAVDSAASATFYGDDNIPMGSSTFSNQSGMYGTVDA